MSEFDRVTSLSEAIESRFFEAYGATMTGADTVRKKESLISEETDTSEFVYEVVVIDVGDLNKAGDRYIIFRPALDNLGIELVAPDGTTFDIEYYLLQFHKLPGDKREFEDLDEECVGSNARSYAVDKSSKIIPLGHTDEVDPGALSRGITTGRLVVNPPSWI